MAEKQHFRILVVDDEEAARYSVRRALSREGTDVALAASGEEALEALDPLKVDTADLVLLDLSMP